MSQQRLSPGSSACTQGQTIQHWHWCHCTRVFCEVWESSSDVWTHLNCIAFCPWACSIPHPEIQWEWITVGTMFVCDINIYLEHDACNLRTSIKLNRFCVFGQKSVRTGCKRQGQRMGEGWGGLATCVCNANEHGPPQLFLHCCAYGGWHRLHVAEILLINSILIHSNQAPRYSCSFGNSVS